MYVQKYEKIHYISFSLLNFLAAFGAKITRERGLTKGKGVSLVKPCDEVNYDTLNLEET